MAYGLSSESLRNPGGGFFYAVAAGTSALGLALVSLASSGICLPPYMVCVYHKFICTNKIPITAISTMQTSFFNQFVIHFICKMLEVKVASI